MKKIVFIVFLSGLCVGVFSQNIDVFEDLEESYESLGTQEEKLDFIFNNILNKQISDYNSLKKEHLSLKEKYKSLQSGSSVSQLHNLKLEKDKLHSEIIAKNKTISELKIKIKDLERNKESFLQLQKTERKRIKAEIDRIFKHQALIAEDLLIITQERASDYQIDAKSISELNKFIDISKQIIQAQNLLLKRVNVSEVESQLIALKNIRNDKFTFLAHKVELLIILLEEYCTRSQELFDMFVTVDNSSYTDKDLKAELKKKRSLFISFPFLFDEITKKIKNIGYRGQVQECY